MFLQCKNLFYVFDLSTQYFKISAYPLFKLNAFNTTGPRSFSQFAGGLLTDLLLFVRLLRVYTVAVLSLLHINPKETLWEVFNLTRLNCILCSYVWLSATRYHADACLTHPRTSGVDKEGQGRAQPPPQWVEGPPLWKDEIRGEIERGRWLCVILKSKIFFCKTHPENAGNRICGTLDFKIFRECPSKLWPWLRHCSAQPYLQNCITC